MLVCYVSDQYSIVDTLHELLDDCVSTISELYVRHHGQSYLKSIANLYKKT